MSRLSGKKLEERVYKEANHFLRNATTVRETAKKFQVGKSTVYRDLTLILKVISPQEYREVKALMNINKRERHIRGGKATKAKYSRLKKQS